MSDAPLTFEEAARLTKLARIRALNDVLKRHGIEERRMIATELYSAWQAVKGYSADDCDDIHPEFGQCERLYGHEPFVTRETIAKAPEQLAKLTNPQPMPPPPGRGEGWVTYEDHQYGGHYTTEYEDKRRPDGSHPWDY